MAGSVFPKYREGVKSDSQASRESGILSPVK
jgi:hypothetical protein